METLPFFGSQQPGYTLTIFNRDNGCPIVFHKFSKQFRSQSFQSLFTDSNAAFFQTIFFQISHSN